LILLAGLLVRLLIALLLATLARLLILLAWLVVMLLVRIIHFRHSKGVIALRPPRALLPSNGEVQLKTMRILSRGKMAGLCKTAHVARFAVRAINLVVQNNIQQRTVDLHGAVVLNEAQFPKFVHEMIYA
jgi:hypothetical protein